MDTGNLRTVAIAIGCVMVFLGALQAGCEALHFGLMEGQFEDLRAFRQRNFLRDRLL